MTPNKPDPTNGEEKMREKIEEFVENGYYFQHEETDYKTCDSVNPPRRKCNCSAREEKNNLANDISTLFIALLEQMIGEMPREHSHAEPTLREHCNSYCGFNRALDQINTDLRIKIEELKKTI